MNILIFLVVLLAIVVLSYIGYILYLKWLTNSCSKIILAKELEAIRTQAQIVDVREKTEFDAKHIMGARNIPISQFAQRHSEVRRDTAVYLYDDNENLAPRAARRLKKNGHNEIYILKNGFGAWTGKTKVTK